MERRKFGEAVAQHATQRNATTPSPEREGSKTKVGGSWVVEAEGASKYQRRAGRVAARSGSVGGKRGEQWPWSNPTSHSPQRRTTGVAG